MEINFKWFRISLASLILIILIVALICALVRQDIRFATIRGELRSTELDLQAAQDKANYLRGVERDLKDVRRNAAEKFIKYDERLQSVRDAWMEQLEGALNHKEPAVRHWAAEKLGQFGVDAIEFVAALREVEHDSDPNVRAAAARAIKRIEGDGTDHDGR